jgi:hypothetical protein
MFDLDTSEIHEATQGDRGLRNPTDAFTHPDRQDGAA